jgi:hypothetical protein
MSNKVVYIEFSTLFNELYKRADDYYGEGTFMGFKTRMDSFISNFKSEYFKNLAILNKENKNSYIKHLNNELEKLRNYFYPGDKRFIDILTKFDIEEETLFTHEKTNNELYKILTTELSNLKHLYKRDFVSNVNYDEVVDILRIFYKQFSHSFVEGLTNFIYGGETSASNENKKNKKSFGFGRDKIEVLRKIYHELVFNTGDFINKHKTSEADFLNILTANNYDDVSGVIKFGCETTQVAYVITAMQNISEQFTFENVGDSKKFFSKNNNSLKSSNLYKSKSKSPKPKEFEYIDSFFKK